jgi:hypothetical protein
MSERSKDPEWRAVIKYYDGLEGAEQKAIGLVIALSYVQEGRDVVVMFQQIEDEGISISDADSTFARMQEAGLIKVKPATWAFEISFHRLRSAGDGS